MTDSITLKNENEFKIVGISKRENKKFWLKQNNLMFKFSKGIKIYLVFLLISFLLPISFMRYNSPIYIFLPNLVILFFHYGLYIIHIITMQLYFNLFIFQIIYFLTYKFDKLILKLKKLNQLKIKQSNYNLKLNRLIFEFNYVYLESRKINILFKKFIGLNYFHVFGYEVTCIFSGIFGKY